MSWRSCLGRDRVPRLPPGATESLSSRLVRDTPYFCAREATVARSYQATREKVSTTQLIYNAATVPPSFPRRRVPHG